jgi:hypothetical protein
MGGKRTFAAIEKMITLDTKAAIHTHWKILNESWRVVSDISAFG